MTDRAPRKRSLRNELVIQLTLLVAGGLVLPSLLVMRPATLPALDRPLSFTLALLLEGTGAGGSVTAPDQRLPSDRELAVYRAVQDALLLSCGPRPVRVRVALAGDWILAVIRADIGELDELVAALGFRLGLLGGAARPLARGRGVALRLPLAHSE